MPARCYFAPAQVHRISECKSSPRCTPPSGRISLPHRRPQWTEHAELLFRSSHLIVESDETDLVRDVCFSIDRAQAKLKRIQRRLKDVQEQAAARVQLLTAAETKLTAAIVATLLSTRGTDEPPPSIA
jgi:hypothetical protein